jgi:hypothetical protein
MSSKQVQIQRAIAQFTDRQPVPEIDFTTHVLDDGTAVNTQERVIKDVRLIFFRKYRSDGLTRSVC